MPPFSRIHTFPSQSFTLPRTFSLMVGALATPSCQSTCTTHPVRKLLSAGRQRYVHPCAIAGTGDDVHLFIAQHHAASCCSWRTMLPFSIQCDSTESGSEVRCCFNVAKR